MHLNAALFARERPHSRKLAAKCLANSGGGFQRERFKGLMRAARASDLQRRLMQVVGRTEQARAGGRLRSEIITRCTHDTARSSVLLIGSTNESLRSSLNGVQVGRFPAGRPVGFSSSQATTTGDQINRQSPHLHINQLCRSALRTLKRAPPPKPVAASALACQYLTSEPSKAFSMKRAH